jgi:hypothetical protein
LLAQCQATTHERYAFAAVIEIHIKMLLAALNLLETAGRFLSQAL